MTTNLAVLTIRPSPRVQPERDDAATTHTLRMWLAGGGPIVCQEALAMGDLLRALSEEIESFMRDGGEPRVETRSVAWVLERSGGNIMLTPHTDPGRVRTVVFPVREEDVSFGTLWQWRRRRAENFWFFHDGCWHEMDSEAALARRLFRRLVWPIVRTVSPGMGLDPEQAEKVVMTWAAGRRNPFKIPEIHYDADSRAGWECWNDFIAADNACTHESPGLPMGCPLRVTQYIGALYAGGAERQLCNLTLGLAEGRHDVRVLTAYDGRGGRGHYEKLLARQRIPVRTARGRPQMILDMPPAHRQLLRAVPADKREQILRLASELAVDRPDVLHCWLDEPNILGGLAGLYAGVPRILLSFRNVNPTHFPRLLKPHMRDWYQLLSQSRRVHFLANSYGGAASYAAWLRIREERIHVVLNGVCFDHFPEPTAANHAAARRTLGLQKGTPVLLGVFRFDDEKQPELFLEVARRVRRQINNLEVAIAGTGPLESAMRDFIDRYDMQRFVHLLGRREDIGQVYLAGDVLLLTSTLEGCPNVALEAQYLGVPVVATDGGGTRDAILPDQTGFLADSDTPDDLADKVVQLFRDQALHATMSARGPRFVREQFSLGRMVQETVQVYRRIFADAGKRGS
jgi:glycosyltransferase involved in cell wall biosynthesis